MGVLVTKRIDETGAAFYRRAIVPYREKHAAAKLCRWCPKPVAAKRDGSLATLCAAHLKYERERFADRKAP